MNVHEKINKRQFSIDIRKLHDTYCEYLKRLELLNIQPFNANNNKKLANIKKSLKRFSSKL